MPQRFNSYRGISAKFDSIATCGHPVKAGDAIGFAPSRRRGAKSETQCADCWAKWQAENAEADAIEAGYMPSCL